MKDALVHALLQLGNIPDRDCKLSLAEILFSRTLKDAILQLDKSKMVFEQDKCKMDPGSQIYLSNNNKNFGQKWFFNNKIKKKFRKKKFSEKS